MQILTIPSDEIVSKEPLSFRRYISDVILPLPFWRSRDGAALTDELYSLLDSDTPTFKISNDLLQALIRLMQLSEHGVGQLNPLLARASINFVRALYSVKSDS